MLIVRATDHGKKKVRILVTDAVTGEPVSGVVNRDVGETILKAITGGDVNFTIEQAKTLILGDGLGVSTTEKAEKARQRHDISMGEDGTVILPSGAVLSNAFRRMLLGVHETEDVEAVIAFGEKLAENPLDHARDALIEWIVRNPSLALTRDGDVIGYRGLNSDHTSIHAGYGIVNGVHYTHAHLDNSPGNVIEFPREMIDHNPDRKCSVGIHVGTWDYAYRFSQGQTVAVTFSPADVVSPPSDSAQDKIRVCRMVVRADIQDALPSNKSIYDDSDF